MTDDEKRARRNASRRARYALKREEILAKQKVYEDANRARRRATGRAYYERNKDKLNEQHRQWEERIGKDAVLRLRRERNLRKKYGIGLDEYEQMLSRQNVACAICASTESAKGQRFAVDHCHRTGRVRGLLCMKCNSAIGKLGDDPDTLRRAIAYLESN